MCDSFCAGDSLGIQTWKFSGPGQVRDAGNGLFIYFFLEGQNEGFMWKESWVLRSWSRERSGTEMKRAASSHDKKSSGMLHLALKRVT